MSQSTDTTEEKKYSPNVARAIARGEAIRNGTHIPEYDGHGGPIDFTEDEDEGEGEDEKEESDES